MKFDLLWKRPLRALLLSLLACNAADAADRQPIHALYIPLADHYAALVAYERYRHDFKHADFRIEQMKNWDLLRAYFRSGRADMAYVMSPLALDMYREKPNFRWVGLMHRDGNGLAVTPTMAREMQLADNRMVRKPNQTIATTMKAMSERSGRPLRVGVPHVLSTHTVVLYNFLKKHDVDISLAPNMPGDVLVIPVAPAKAPSYILGAQNSNKYVAIEQSLPWVDQVEKQHFGEVAWYSKDVMAWPGGHVECIAIATDKAMAEKREALQEVMAAIQQAGEDIERARNEGGAALDEIVKTVRKHIPAHTPEAIISSLDPRLRIINYQNLGVDKEGMHQIMNLGVEAGVLKQAVDLDEFADDLLVTPEAETP
jgi:NitT/TauT family transport system substrate-binding protein